MLYLFQALPIVVFFSSVMSVLYFLGIMQWLILKVTKQIQIYTRVNRALCLNLLSVSRV